MLYEFKHIDFSRDSLSFSVGLFGPSSLGVKENCRASLHVAVQDVVIAPVITKVLHALP